MMEPEKKSDSVPPHDSEAANLENKNFQSQLIQIVSLPVVFILILLVFFHLQNAHRQSLVSDIRRGEQVRLELLRFEKSVASTENAMRGFVLSGNEEFYFESLAEMERAQALYLPLLASVKEAGLRQGDLDAIHQQFTNFKGHVATTLKIRKQSESAEEAAERLVSFQSLLVALTSSISEFEVRLQNRTRSLDAQMADVAKRTRIIEIIFTFSLAFFVVFFMIRQLKKMTLSYRTLLEKNLANLEQIKESSRTKDLFLANMSHEIRTPLGAIMGFAELLFRQKKLDPVAQDHISFIHRNSEHLLGLIDDLFDLSRLSADKLGIENEELSLRELIVDIKNNFRKKITDKSIDLDIILLSRVPERIETDPLRLTQIITNLVGNAIKFSPEGATIKVQFSFTGDELQVDVIDRGMGIESSLQTVIFEAFTQADINHSRNFGGAGLGLSISKKLARAMGGDLMLVSSVVNEGSHFRVVIPCLSSSIVFLDRDSLGHVEHIDDHTDAHIEEIPEFDFSDKKILLAEDSKENQILFQIFIQSTAAQLEIVDNGTDAVRRALSDDFDLILMDIQMPGLDGYEAVGILRNSMYRKKIIALTAHTMKGEKEKCLSSGFDSYLSKPVSQANLLQTMDKALRSRREFSGTDH